MEALDRGSAASAGGFINGDNERLVAIDPADLGR